MKEEQKTDQKDFELVYVREQEGIKNDSVLQHEKNIQSNKR